MRISELQHMDLLRWKVSMPWIFKVVPRGASVIVNTEAANFPLDVNVRTWS